MIGNAALEPVEERTEGEQHKGGPVEKTHGTEHPNGDHKLEVMRRDELFLLLNLHPLTDALGLGVLGLDQLLQAGLEKPGFLYKKTSPVFFWFFGVFWFFLYICPEERVFRVFSVSRIL
jgi:hypothetical protein